MKWKSKRLSISVVVVIAFGVCSRAIASDLPDEVEFNRDIRPILSENCFFCHGPDRNKRQAELRLDTEAGLKEGKDGRAGTIISGKSDESVLVHRVTSRDPDQVMPPIESGKKLSAPEIELLKRWIDQGAKFEGHWAFLPIKRQAPPTTTSNSTSAKAQNEIERFVRDGLAKVKLKPPGEADRTTLIRRLCFDLIGLPPTVEQVDAFVGDKSSDAYERLVDQLLESPYYGERLAIWWLDLVRYADTVGYHGDQDVSVSPFRQYVIESFNSNKRFDQFTIEQLAGDLLVNPTREQKIASGYNRLGMMSAEGGVQDKEYLAKYIAERVRNASGTWLGVTLGCAECHDHKYDPFTTRDFYQFEAFFADIKEQGLYAGANDTGVWGTAIEVPTVEQETALAELDQKIIETKNVLNLATPELIAAQTEWEQKQVRWTVLKPDSFVATDGVAFARRDDGSFFVSGTIPSTDNYVMRFNDVPLGITAFRLEVLPDDSLPQKGPGHSGNGNFVLTEFLVSIKHTNGKEQTIDLKNASATYEQTAYADGNPYGKWSIAAAIDRDEKGKKWGWAVLEKVGQPHAAIFETATDLSIDANSQLVVQLLQSLENAQHTIGRFRLSATNSPRPVTIGQSLPSMIEAILAISSVQRTQAQQTELASYFRSIAPQLDASRRELNELEKKRKELDATVTRSLVTVAVPPRMVRILKRGNWMDESGEVVEPDFPAILSPGRSGKTRMTRLDLAKWMTSPENPLTARVFVNRIWKLLFGAGLSRRVDDLGAQGDSPSHPQLLDDLAAKFIDSGWDVKRLIKSIVMTETYRQSSIVRPEVREVDPYNRWLARQGRFRLDAELVRDNALAVSGLLVTRLGGKSVKPYQPPGYWAYLNFPTREWQNATGDDLYRRGLYTHWQRQYLHPSLIAFDAPSREECTADRPRSNTPLQSLVLLNDPSYVEAARAFAEQLMRNGGKTPSDRLNFAFRRAVSRNISSAESDVLQKLFQKHLDEYRSDAASINALLSVGAKPAPTDLDRAELAAWTSVARTILNLHETITRN